MTQPISIKHLLGKLGSVEIFGNYDPEAERAKALELLPLLGGSSIDGIRFNPSDVISAFDSKRYCENDCPGLSLCKRHGYRAVLDPYPGRLSLASAPCHLRIAATKDQEMSSRVKGMIRRFTGKSFEDFIVDGRSQSVRAAYEIAQAVSKNQQSLVLAGGLGTGKTHLASAIAKEAMEAGRSVIFATAPEMMRNLRSFGEDGEYDQVMDDLCSCSLLVIDDVGTEKMSPWCSEQYYSIFNSRYNDMLQTVITTNIETPDLLADHWRPLGGRIISRLYELCDWVLIIDTDWRKELRQSHRGS